MSHSNPDVRQARIRGFTENIIARRWLVVAAAILLVAGIGAGVTRLHISSDYRVFFSRENPQLSAFDALQNVYTKTDTVMFIVTPKGGDVFTAETLGVIQELTREAWKIPYAIRVDSLTNFQETRADGDLLVVDDLVPEGEALSARELARVRSVAMSEPFLRDLVVSSRGHVTSVVATLQLPGKSLDEVAVGANAARRLASEIERRHPGIDVRLNGDVIFNNAFNEAAEADGKTLNPLMLLVLIVAAFVVLRSFAATVAAWTVVVMAAVAAMGAAGWMNVGLTPVTVLAPSMVLIIAICDVIHVLVSVTSEMRTGKSKRDAIVASIAENFRPVTLTALTTMIGFLTMNFSDSPPLKHLGNITAVGILAALVLSLTFLPALLSILPMRLEVRASRGDVRLAGLANFVLRRHRPLFWTSAVLVLVLGGCVTLNQLGDNFVEYFDHRFAIRGDTEYLVENLTGFYRMEMSIGAGRAGGISDPEYLRTLDRFAVWLRNQPEVIHVATFADTMKRLNRSMHGDEPRAYAIPADADEAAQYLLLYEMSLPRGQDLNDRISVDKSATRVVVAIRTVTTAQIRSVSERAQEWLRRSAPAHMASQPTGPTVMFAYIFDRNVRGMIGGTFIGIVIIGAVMILALRSVRFGLLSLIPNIVPAAVAFGLWGLFEGEVSFAISVVAPMTLGIVDDDTVHWMSRYLDARRQGASVGEAIRSSFGSVGRAVLATSFILTAGFVVLASSGFRMNSDMALMTAVTILVAMLADLFLLPPLLMLADRDRPLAAAHVDSEAA